MAGLKRLSEQAVTEEEGEESVAANVPTVARELSPPEAEEGELAPYSSLPTAQIEQAIAMHRARISGRVDTVAGEKEEAPSPDQAEDVVPGPEGQVAEMHDRLKHALDELQALKDKHAIQTRELESYQERADLLEDPDADVTKLRIQLSDLKRKFEEADRKLYAKDKEVLELKKLVEDDETGADEDRISAADHESSVREAVEAAKKEAAAEASAASEKQRAKEIAELVKQHKDDIRKLEEQAVGELHGGPEGAGTGRDSGKENRGTDRGDRTTPVGAGRTECCWQGA